jgi:hypothetical protein
VAVTLRDNDQRAAASSTRQAVSSTYHVMRRADGVVGCSRVVLLSCQGFDQVLGVVFTAPAGGVHETHRTVRFPLTLTDPETQQRGTSVQR